VTAAGARVPSNGGRPGDVQPDDGRPDDALPDDGRPDDARPEDGRSDDGRPDDGRPPRRRRRLAGWLALVVVVAGALAFGVTDDAGPRTSADRARSLAESVACPVCDGQSVADSDSDAAKGIRARIDERLADGASDAQIRDELAAAYGEQILLTPGRSGVSSLVWTLPVVALVVALAGLAFAFRRWRGGGAAQASDADRALVDQARHAATVGAHDADHTGGGA
jgi:cytochrome c-type biogenesis protein CcmH